ncbi:ABC transporter substrate-binding protein [Rhizobiales bacterium RZME27]|uniref:ABC transporter substrate-binding protein n=1 Tax=Endobacterium cereale TaxID=2663029 RepID=A0A6A8A7W6_9HYPH|nr:branched-chain amino acid ABC transporter substrate-binding protein [Endobacterium cereale]MQY47365.1 ABC transporter substrate-binding protein [Endobacterium cereale]
MIATLKASIFAVSGLLIAGAGPTIAATIGVVAPQNGAYAGLGAQVLEGARAAATKNGDRLVEINETCEQGAGKAIAKRLRAEQAVAAIGFLCVETLSETLPLLKDGRIAAITLSVRSKILMEDAQRYEWPFFRMAPVDGDEAEKLAEVMLTQWQNRPIALVEDGTIYGRDLASVIRQKLEAGGIKPVFTDTYRPGQEQQLALVRRLTKAGATHVFVGGDRNDTATIARDATADKINLTVIGGDALKSTNRPIPLHDGVLAVTLPDYTTLPETQTVVGEFRERGTEPDGYALPAYAAVEIVRQAAASGNVIDRLAGQSFETVIGSIGFGTDHELQANPLKLLEWRDNNFLAPAIRTD